MCVRVCVCAWCDTERASPSSSIVKGVKGTRASAVCDTSCDFFEPGRQFSTLEISVTWSAQRVSKTLRLASAAPLDLFLFVDSFSRDLRLPRVRVRSFVLSLFLSSLSLSLSHSD